MNNTIRNLLLTAGCLVITGSFSMTVRAEDLKDLNPYRQQTVTAMDENGNITEIGDSDGIIEGGEVSEERALQSTTSLIVNFNTKNNAVTNFIEDGTGEAGYTNGDYGADAAYLGTSNGKVKFMMSGVVGWVDVSEVQVIDVSRAAVVSGYYVENGRLIHGVVHDMTTPGYRTRLDNGAAPDYLKENVKYYSYDGHYFYEDYSLMLQDYQNNSRSNSVNPQSPYYNYFQYLPLRSTTSLSEETLNNLINEKASAYPESKMMNTGNTFLNAQNKSGVNALLMAGIAANESGWGSSSIAKKKNNLFGLNATDANPGEDASIFTSITACINDFADGWLSKGYLYPGDRRYFGGFLGNKASGLGVKYASDPYWGERNANLVYSLDKMQNNQDYQAYTIGIKDTVSTSHNSVKVYKEADSSSKVLYETKRASSYSVLILDASVTNGFYKIQSDAVLTGDRSAATNDTGGYNFNTMYGYIPAESIYIASESEFVDVPESAWFYDSVSYVNDKGLMTGLNSRYFGAGENLARAQFALIIYRMNHEPAVTFEQIFQDVYEGTWYTDAVLWASSKGVVTGYSNGNFGPGDQINREQMATMMYRYAESKRYDVGQKSDISGFNDAFSVSAFAKEAMEWAYGSGVITGKYGETMLDPQGNATRAECATIIMRFLNQYGE